ncbi:T9SS type A sorting domain-containing protein, partial [Lutibacter sp.]
KLTNADTTPTWTDITGPSFVGSISSVEFGATENDIFVTFHNYGVASVWYSADGGTTWQNKEGDLPDMPVKCILQNPLLANEVIIGTELGVWTTTNFGNASPNWVSATNGMRDVKVLDLDLRTADNTILATTFGRGTFTGVFTSASLSVDDQFFEKTGTKVYPTVSNGDFFISSNTDLGETHIEVYTFTGKKVYSKKTPIYKGYTIEVSISGVASGVYILKLTSDTSQGSKRIVVK